jgi:hypothetical protein
MKKEVSALKKWEMHPSKKRNLTSNEKGGLGYTANGKEVSAFHKRGFYCHCQTTQTYVASSSKMPTFYEHETLTGGLHSTQFAPR